MNKASGSKSTSRGLGSIDVQATARSVLIVGRVKDDQTLRVIAHDKSSLAPEGQSIAFRLDRNNGFSWEGSCDISVDELLSGDTKGSKIREAKSFLTEYLANGQKSSSEIEDAASSFSLKSPTSKFIAIQFTPEKPSSLSLFITVPETEQPGVYSTQRSSV